MYFFANAIADEGHLYEENEVQMILNYLFDFCIVHLDNLLLIY